MLELDFLTIAVPVIVVGFTILFILLPRYGPHYKSRLVCPKCQKAFFYHWVPGATFTTLTHGNNRNLKCPYCHTQATYNIARTRVAKLKQSKPANPEAT